MYVAAVSHAVADYDRWKAIYDETSPTAVGTADFSRVHRLLDDQTQIMTTVCCESLDELKAFLDAPELGEHMERAGVIGEVQIQFYELVDETSGGS